MSVPSTHLPQSQFTPEQQAAALPWLIACLIPKCTAIVLFICGLTFGYFIPGHSVFRVTVALCAIAVVVDPLFFVICCRKLNLIEGDPSTRYRRGWSGLILSLTFRGFLAYQACLMWVFPPAS
jgi:hypothetical protein